MKKSTRRKITLTILALIIIFLIYSIIHTITNKKTVVEKAEHITTKTTTGTDLPLTKNIKDLGIDVFKDDNIIEIVDEEYSKIEKVVTKVTVETNHSVEEIVNHYKEIYPQSMTAYTDNSTVIIAGESEQLIRFIISEGSYIIELEER